MTVTYQTPIRIDQFTQRLRFTSNAATPVSFRAYREGRLLAAWTSPDGAGVLDVVVPEGESPFLEVLDNADAIPAIAFPGRFTLVWDRTESSDRYSYAIEQYSDGAWTTLDTILDDGRLAYWWQTGWLADCTVHNFRIVPIDTAGNRGSEINYAVEMVRHPDVPNVTITPSGVKRVLIQEA